MTTPLDPKKTTLLLLDLQNGFLSRLPEEASRAVLSNAASAIATSRKHGAVISYIRAALSHTDLQGVPDHNTVFGAFKTSSEMAAAIHPDSPSTQIHAALAPQDGDLVHRKVRFGAFMREPSMGLLEDFSERGIENVVLGGVVTSGAVLSAVRQLADLDFRIVVLKDVCGDYDESLHQVLMEKVFPKQALVVGSSKLEGLFR